MSSKKETYKSEISNESFKQLAKNNVKKSIKDYMIYFITLSFGAALLYSFNSIDTVLSKLMGNGLLDAYVNMSRGVLALFSILICIIFGFLITYANNFLMKRRKREFAIYSVLGMDKRDINKLMFMETTIIGAISLGIGLLFGIVASQGISIIAFKMINLEFSEVGFTISISSIVKTILLFVFVLFLVNKFNKKNIEKYSLIELIKSNTKNEIFNQKDGKANIIVFISSFILIILTYAAIKSLHTPNLIIIGIAIIIIALATYLFFISIADFVINQIKRHKKVYYNKLTMFTISQLSSRIKSMSMLITTICLIIFTSLIIMPFGMGMANYMKQDLGITTPFDASVLRYNTIENNESYFEQVFSDNPSFTNTEYNSIKNEMIKLEVPFNEVISDSYEVKVYMLDNIKVSVLGDDSNYKSDYNMPIISLSDYNNIRELQGLDEIALDDNEFALNGRGAEENKIIEEAKSSDSKPYLNINGNELKFSNISSDIYYYNYNASSIPLTVIVPDFVVSNLYPVITYLNVYYSEPLSKSDDIFSLSVADYKILQNINVSFDSKIVIDGEKASFNIVFAFTSIYMGIILLISAGAILALQLISQSTDNNKRFILLRNIGVKEKDIKKSIFTQVLVIFLMPLLLAGLHYIMISSVLNSLIAELASVGILQNIFISSAIVIIVYGAYFLVSYLESINIISERKNK